ncbi:GTP-binding protein Di-Ras1 [Lates japonicus]|uniref:GTP-binding protein Di-Ras1 n=1 Tax=Lates japonicus TaxID=270547 RepID=A0AAD3M5D9_LATJO|nr:GTP-binding protein Di-Ras1 [Lates japonicus]
MPEQSNDYRMVVLGAGGVGKSSLVLRFVKGTFRDTYIPTVEDTYRQVISCDKSVCTLQITDTTGSHQFPAMQRLSISKGHAFILVYSITNSPWKSSNPFTRWRSWPCKGTLRPSPSCLWETRATRPSGRWRPRMGEAHNQWKCAFMETSAKTNHNVNGSFFQEPSTWPRRDMSPQHWDGKPGKQSLAERLKGNAA